MDTGPHPQFPQAAFAGADQTSAARFDIFEWYPQYQSCQQYFLDHAQHSVPVQALAAFLNIRLPFQRQPNPTFNYPGTGIPGQGPTGFGRSQPFRVHSLPSPSLTPPSALDPCVSLIPASGMLFRTPLMEFRQLF